MGLMIVYDLICAQQHRFEGWFGSSEEFTRQRGDALIRCPMCDDAKIERRPSANIQVGRATIPAPETPSPDTEHKDALIMLAQRFAGIESQEATMSSVDRLGFHLRLSTPGGIRSARIAFLREVRNPTDTRKVLVEMVQQARH